METSLKGVRKWFDRKEFLRHEEPKANPMWEDGGQNQAPGHPIEGGFQRVVVTRVI